MSPDQPLPPDDRRASLLTLAFVALVALVPFAPGLARGGAFYYRDIARHFFSIRLFVADGLRHGELRYWNPYLHEGEPVSGYALSYPLELLYTLLPSDWGLSFLLALHVSLAAVTFVLLARSLGGSRAAAAGGGIVYALGGFGLSTVNLYIPLLGVAWAPLVVWAARRAAAGNARQVAQSALIVAVALSTHAWELLLAAFLIGVALATPLREARTWVRIVCTGALALGLAAPLFLPLPSVLAGSARSGGLSTSSVVAYSIHPVTFLQTVAANLHGDLHGITSVFWGFRFTPPPYFLSYYVGAAALALVLLAAATRPQRLTSRLLLIATLGVVVALGPWSGLHLLLDRLPFLRVLRFPSKAFFAVHLALALLAAQGLDALRSNNWRAHRLLTLLAGALGGALVAGAVCGWTAPSLRDLLADALFLPSVERPLRLEGLALILGDAATGGAVALAVGILALLAWRGRLQPRLAVLGSVALIVVDLVRTGSGLNPTAPPTSFELSPEMKVIAAEMKAEGGRLFTCEPELARPFAWARDGWGRQGDRWAAIAFVETLSVAHNLRTRIPSAYSRDLTMFVPSERLLTLGEVSCAQPAAITARLREAGVAHVISLFPLEAPDLTLRARVTPPRLAPLSVYLYRLREPLPLRAVATSVVSASSAGEALRLVRQPGFLAAGGTVVEGARLETHDARGRIVASHEGSDRIELVVEADRPTVLLVRDAFAAGWTATVDGAPAPLLRAEARHRAVPVGAGTSRVVLRYRLPGLAAGLCVAALSLIATGALFLYARLGRGAPVAHADTSER